MKPVEAPQGKSIEEKFRKLSDIEHALLRPGMWVGSTKPREDEIFLMNEEGKLAPRKVAYNPALMKIFDEIVSNSIDEHRRNPKLNEIKVSVDELKGSVRIWDNGGIPVVKHAEYDEWVPEMIFSNLKAGSNFNDDEERLVAGTNGVGSTLTNIFSQKFRVRTCDGKNAFEQTFSNNMRERTDPKIVAWKEKFTEIAFVPDLPRFGLETIDRDHLDMMQRRCMDLAACNPKLKVTFNSTEFKYATFKDYCALYNENVIYEETARWKIGIAPSMGSFTQVSFVNSVETRDGGTHVDYVMSQIVEWLREKVKRKHKVDLRPAELRNHFFLFIQSDIVNPAFSSQTKEKMITEAKEFGSKFEINEKTLKAILASEVVQRILDWAQQKALADERKQLRELNRNLGKEKVLKLVDAKSKEREKCTLSLYEGDCLDSETEVIVFRSKEGAHKVRIADVKVGDHVITHMNGLREVTATSSKISKIFEVKTCIGVVRASGAHRMWVYDIHDSSFKFTRVDELVSGRHRMVKNKLSSACIFMRVIDIKDNENHTIVSCDDDILLASQTHKFAVLDIDDQRFKMIQASKLIANRHYLVLNSVN